MKKIYLPCIRGVIGNWTYYSTVMKIRDIVENSRVITVAESPDLYTKNINNILQREISPSRISQISRYLLNNNERFFSSLTLAIHKGNPQWFDISLGSQFEVENKSLSDGQLEFIENKFGILSLEGNEQIFALDGQHRLVGLREAMKKNSNLGEEEIALIFVVHNAENRERTRRLFTVLNKYAEKPKGAELIILDEDDSAAINTRRLLENHPVFIKENALSSTKTGNIPSNDHKSFTTLVTVNKINKILYKKDKEFYTLRPADEILESLYEISKNFWDFLFDVFPEIVNFVEGERGIDFHGVFDRNSDSGGSLLLRPIGQELVARLYKAFLNTNQVEILQQRIRNVNFNLSGNTLKYLFWNNGKMQSKEEDLKFKLLAYLVGLDVSHSFINDEMQRIYNNFNDEYRNHLSPIV